MALRKPSEYFGTRNREQVISVENSIENIQQEVNPETFSDAFESFKNNLNKIEVLSEFSKTLGDYSANIEKINILSESVTDIQEEIENFLTKEDLDRALVSQLLLVEQSVRDVQTKVKSINQKSLREIRDDVSELTESVNQFFDVDVPKYKKLLVDSEVRTHSRYNELKEDVNKTLSGIEDFVNNRYEYLTETLQGINEENLEGIISDFEILREEISTFKENDIPKYKNLIIDTEIKTQNKLNQFQEKLDETISSILEKVNLVESDKNDLVDIVNQRIKSVKSLSEKVTEHIKTSQVINENYKEEIGKKIKDLQVEIVRNESHIKDQNGQIENIQEEFRDVISRLQIELCRNENNISTRVENIQEEVRGVIARLQLEKIEEKNYELTKKVNYLEEIFEKFNSETLTEGLLNEPPDIKNDDPLTPLDKNFVTVEQLQEHYRLFINRIQQQLSTLGGGGETRLKYLDDIVGIATNASAYDGKFLKYTHSLGKFEFVTVSGGGGSGDYASVAGIATYATAAGIATYASTAGIATYATTAGVSTYASTAGIATYATTAGIATYASTSGIATYATAAGIATYSSRAGIATYATTAGVATVSQGLTGTPNITVGIVTATSYNGSGSNLTGIVTYIQAGIGISISQNTGNVVITSTGGGGESYWVSTNAGIHTLSNVGIGTTNPETSLEINGQLGFTGDNILIGNKNTGSSITTGGINHFFGIGAGNSNTSGSYNSFFGSSSGYCNQTGNYNNFFGHFSGFCSQNGSYNTFFGHFSGYYNTIGCKNSFFGTGSGNINETGSYNNFFGNYVGVYTNRSYRNIFGFGTDDLNSFDAPKNADKQFAVGLNSTGTSEYWIVGNENLNVGIGTTNPLYKLHIGGDINFTGTLFQNGTPFSGGGGSSQWVTTNVGVHTLSNVGIGTTNPLTKLYLDGVLGFPNSNIRIGDNSTGCSITNGSDNLFFGREAGKYNTTGSSNNFFGTYAGYANTSGILNNFFGPSAGYSNLTGCYNNFFGLAAGRSNISGNYNTFFGSSSGYNNTDGNYNNFLGAYSGISTSASHKVILGSGVYSGASYYFDSPNPNKDVQLAVGVRTDSNSSNYWIVGNENFNVGIGTTNPTSKLTVGGDIRVGFNTSQGIVLTSPNGNKYRIIVDNSGNLSATLVV